MKMRSLLALLLAMCLCLAPVSAYADGGDAVPQVGDPMPDFTFTTFDGTEYTLSEVLQEKEMVLINLWATWCGPCEMEFPNMEAAYEQYKDSVEIFALSVEPEDTDDVLAEYVDSHGMTFPVGRDEAGLGDMFVSEGIPTSLVVDRFGVICAMEVGSQTAEEAFPMLFDAFTGDEYTQSNVMDGFPKPPPATPTVEATDPEALTEALLGESAVEVTVANPEDQYNWPVAAAEDDERSCVTTTNAGTDNSSSAVELRFDAEAGSALVFDYKVSSESGYDDAMFYVNGEPVKSYSGDIDWRTFAYELEDAGSYTVLLAFEKDEMESDGDDAAWFANFRVVTGSAVDEALALMPSYPYAEQSSLAIVDDDAQEIVFDAPEGTLDSEFADSRFFIVPSEQVTLTATLAEGNDAENTYFFSNYDSSSIPFSACVDGDGYTYTAPGIDSMASSGYSYTTVALDGDVDFMMVVLFADEPNVNAFVKEFSEYASLKDGDITWTYADGTAPGTDEVAVAAEGPAEVPEGYSSYTLTFTGPDGEPVEGVIANVCDDEACTPMTSDEDGLIEFVYPSFAYHIQVIKVPDGYSYDTSEETYLEEDGGSVSFELAAAE